MDNEHHTIKPTEPNPTDHPPDRPADHPADRAQQPGPWTPSDAIHFCQGGLKGGGASLGAGLTTAAIPTAILGGIAFAIAGFFALAGYPWLPVAVRATVVTMIFIVLMIALFRVAARGYGRAMSSLKLPMEMDPDARLNVICWPDQKQRLDPLTPTEGDPGYFEPEACRVWITRRTSHVATMLTRKGVRRFLGAMIVGQFLLQSVVLGNVFGFIGRSAMTIACLVVAAVLGGFVLHGFLFPKFFRVAPGRLDIVSFGFLGRPPAIETIDLRSRPVRLDLKRNELLLGGWHPSHPDRNDPTPTENKPPEHKPPEHKPTETPPAEPEPAANGSPAKAPDSPTGSRTNSRTSSGTGSRTVSGSGSRTGSRKEGSLLRRFEDACDPDKSPMPDLQTALGSKHQIKNLTIIPLWATTDRRTLQDAVFRAAASTADPGPLPDDRLID